ncbi:MAG TPA: hypothetical protein VGK99_06565, partial [Acidobacteriota bacterium]
AQKRRALGRPYHVWIGLDTARGQNPTSTEENINVSTRMPANLDSSDVNVDGFFFGCGLRLRWAFVVKTDQ